MKRFLRYILWSLIFVACIYGLGRIYYRVTGGFTIGNITYELPYDARWDIPELTPTEKEILGAILDQEFYYLGKGCQSYVFTSADGNYVLKFFKYQRFRPKPWLDYLTFLPFIEPYRQEKVESKKKKLESVFTSWKIAYQDLQLETGVIFIHLNKSKNLNKNLIIYDKMGIKHELKLDDFEFMIQRKAQMLCPTLKQLISKGDILAAQKLLDRLLSTLLSEYHRGYADNDHALMQNTGVLAGYPLHIDVGQFVKNSRVKSEHIYHQEIFNKTWKFRKWLEKEAPELSEYLVLRLKEIIGEKKFDELKPRLNKAAVGVISHES